MTAVVHVWTLRLDGLDEAATSPWLTALDGSERDRAARFVFPRHRVQYVAAHMLARAALGELTGEPPSAFGFSEEANGKPLACLGKARAPVSFNLSHTEGLVGLAAIAAPDRAIGFDLESAGRPAEMALARRIFCPQEVAWLEGLAPALRGDGFLRLWTLKEAYIKATGEGLSANLSSFWFEPDAPRVHFSPGDERRAAEWRFQQRVIDGAFIAALGVRGFDFEARWSDARAAGVTARGFE